MLLRLNLDVRLVEAVLISRIEHQPFVTQRKLYNDTIKLVDSYQTVNLRF